MGPSLSLYFCISDPLDFISSLNRSCIVNVNADMATVLHIRLIHAIRHANIQSASLTEKTLKLFVHVI